jgi:hypothetical protein
MGESDAVDGRDSLGVSTARFATVVEKYGDPEPHLVLTDPRKDRVLQAAIKAHRVMTVMQRAVGNTADRGVVGFEPGAGRQFLLFPKSLRSLSGKNIVGIKYELMKTKRIPKSERAPSPRKPPKAKPKVRKARSQSAAPTNVVAFRNRKDDDDENPEVTELKRKVRHAMTVLEAGKQVAAFNLLKRIVEN